MLTVDSFVMVDMEECVKEYIFFSGRFIPFEYKCDFFFVKMVIGLYMRSALKKRPQSYGKYLQNETKRNKKKRIEVIKKWYDFIHHDKKNFRNGHPSQGDV